jgi:hypothetical protein
MFYGYDETDPPPQDSEPCPVPWVVGADRPAGDGNDESPG